MCVWVAFMIIYLISLFFVVTCSFCNSTSEWLIYFSLPLSPPSLPLSFSPSLFLPLAPIHNSAHPVSLQLVCSSKEEVTEIFELLRSFTSILTNLHTLKDNGHYVVDLQMERSVLRSLWLQLLSPSVITKLQGLVGVELQGSFLVNFSPQKTAVDETGICAYTCISVCNLLVILVS